MALLLAAFLAACSATPPGGDDPGTGIGPAAVNLGTAGNFVIVAESAITDVPTSAITGDMVLSPNTLAAVTGFTVTPVMDASNNFATAGAELVGKIYTAGGTMSVAAIATAAAAVADKSTAYTDAATRTPAVGPNLDLLGGILPGGTTLTPGLYTWGSNVNLTGDITLSGGANDRWIMQISGTLVQEVGFKVILTGGAQAKNIVWQVAGAGVTLKGGAGSSFNGIILSNTLITTQTGATVTGRLLAKTAVTVGGSTVTQP